MAWGSRTPRVAAAVSSRARSVQAYYPFYPPPVYPEGLERGGYSGFSTVLKAPSTNKDGSSVVRRNNMRQGDRTEYTYGGTTQSTFRMVATGQVESSAHQRVLNYPLVAQFNDFLYRASRGYPRNLGLSEKVPTLPNNVLNPGLAMQPRPRFTRNVFTNRNFGTSPSVPAQPMNG